MVKGEERKLGGIGFKSQEVYFFSAFRKRLQQQLLISERARGCWALHGRLEKDGDGVGWGRGRWGVICYFHWWNTTSTNSGSDKAWNRLEVEVSRPQIHGLFFGELLVRLIWGVKFACASTNTIIFWFSLWRWAKESEKWKSQQSSGRVLHSCEMLSTGQSSE